MLSLERQAEYAADIAAAAKHFAAGLTVTETAAAMGRPRPTVQHWKRAIDASPVSNVEEVQFPDFPDDDVSADEILDSMARRNNKRLEHAAAMKWFKIGMPSDDPIGLAIVGDPHLGSNGCNIALMRSDVALMAGTEGVYAMNIGDTVDNWGGRLLNLYAENDVSKQTERKLARWFLENSGVRWLVWLEGNHDLMDGGFINYLRAINANRIVMTDWQAKFRLAFPNKSETRVNAAHNHKGTSIYNPLHGQKRASLWGGADGADLIVAGHHHTWAQSMEEGDDGHVTIMARARGYKSADDYALHHGFPDRTHGASLLYVIDPRQEDPLRRHKLFPSLAEGCEYLTWLRSK